MNFDNIEISKKLNIVFMGTPDFAVCILEALIQNYSVRAVVTQPDKYVGRNKILTSSAVKKRAEEHEILVLQPTKIKEDYQEILALEPDLIVTCAYGQIIPKVLLDYPKYGCINVHASLLPKYRGGAPIQRAIMNGEKETGITIMYMNEYMDQGNIISQEKIAIEDNDTAGTLYNKLKLLGAKLLIDTLPSILSGTNNSIIQDESLVTYAPIIKREDEKLNFSNNKYKLYNQIRGLSPYPGAYCLYNGQILKVWDAYLTDNIFNSKYDGEITNIYSDGFGVKVSNGELVLRLVQLEGKNKVEGHLFANGMANHKKFIGEILQ